MDERKTVEFDEVRVVVGRANVLMGVKRSRLIHAGVKVDEGDLDRRILRTTTYPDLVAATIETENLTFDLDDFDAFLTADDELIEIWLQAIYTLNPHWIGGTSEKKGSRSQKNSIRDSGTGDIQ